MFTIYTILILVTALWFYDFFSHSYIYEEFSGFKTNKIYILVQNVKMYSIEGTSVFS